MKVDNFENDMDDHLIQRYGMNKIPQKLTPEPHLILDLSLLFYVVFRVD